MLGAFLHTGVARIGTHHVFLAMQQLVDLGDMGHVGRARSRHSALLAPAQLGPDRLGSDEDPHPPRIPHNRVVRMKR